MRVWSCGCTLPAVDFGQKACFTHSLNPRVLYEVLGLLASVCSEHSETDNKAPASAGSIRAKLQLATYQLVATSVCRNSTTNVLHGVATANMMIYGILISSGPLASAYKAALLLVLIQDYKQRQTKWHFSWPSASVFHVNDKNDMSRSWAIQT